MESERREERKRKARLAGYALSAYRVAAQCCRAVPRCVFARRGSPRLLTNILSRNQTLSPPISLLLARKRRRRFVSRLGRWEIDGIYGTSTRVTSQFFMYMIIVGNRIEN